MRRIENFTAGLGRGAKLLATGNVCELHIVPGGGHNFGNDVPEWREKSRELMIGFLKKQGLVTR